MAPVNTVKKVVLVTGGNSGVGLHACLALAKQPNHHVILTGRDVTRVHEAADKVRAAAASSSIVEEGVLDLSSLAAVKAYCKTLLERKDLSVVSALVCNAAVATSTKRATHEGLESAFGVNHMGHFLLATLLRERTERLVVVASEVHNPALMPGTPPLDVSDLEQLAFGYEPYNGNLAYSTSKLCNMLFVAEWTRRFPVVHECISFSPGFTPDTSLSREATLDVARITEMCNINGIAVSTSELSGTELARLAVGDWTSHGWASGQFVCMNGVQEPSKQAQDTELAASLWAKSEELVARLVAND